MKVEIALSNIGRNLIDLSALEQLVDTGQTKTIADAVYYATKYMYGKSALKEVINRVITDITGGGLNTLAPFISGKYVSFRKYE